MAMVDLKTGEITGAEKGTHAYYHEEGHIQFNKNSFAQYLRYYREYGPPMATGFLSFGAILPRDFWLTKVNFIIAFAYMLLWVGVYQVEEVWCNVYAKKKLKQIKLEEEQTNGQKQL